MEEEVIAVNSLIRSEEDITIVCVIVFLSSLSNERITRLSAEVQLKVLSLLLSCPVNDSSRNDSVDG
jgi:hypothetical protein